MPVIKSHPQRKRFAIAGVAIIVFTFGIGLGTRISRLSGHVAAQNIADAPARIFIHQGDRIVVPQGSSLRSHLVIQQVVEKNSAHSLQLPAAVEADPARTVNILPPVAGKVVKLLVRLGDNVVKGQPLVVIDSADLAQAYADDDKARDALHRAELTLKRVRGLQDAGAGALKDLEQAESDYAQAMAEFNRAEARLKEIGVPSQPKDGVRLLTIASPLTGSVITLTTATGAFANDVTASLMTVANLDSVWVTANAPEANIENIAKGQPVDVSFPAYPGQVLHGKVSFVSSVMEPDTRRNKVRISFANPGGKLKPNMFAKANFNVPQKSAVFVPNSALIMDNDSTVVYVEVAPWTFVRRSVLPGYSDGDATSIDQGLNPGERIVAKGGVLLND
ncbi:MAG TPA: efflux RND transporter periplasmic adaptor subunit [Nitrospirota bacterium]|nr:efflux RND transporter periplasmic adaptor subunit [Nitrospirota bacterium]